MVFVACVVAAPESRFNKHAWNTGLIAPPPPRLSPLSLPPSIPVCWLCSILWEVTEVLMAPLLPNFIECWWDQIGFDLIICNGAGIFVGHKICKYVTGEDEKRRGEKEWGEREREREREKIEKEQRAR